MIHDAPADDVQQMLRAIVGIQIPMTSQSFPNQDFLAAFADRLDAAGSWLEALHRLVIAASTENPTLCFLRSCCAMERMCSQPNKETARVKPAPRPIG